MTSLTHDLDFFDFVTEYEDAKGEDLSRSEALRLYTEYDSNWQYQKRQYRQTRNFERDRNQNPFLKKEPPVPSISKKED